MIYKQKRKYKRIKGFTLIEIIIVISIISILKKFQCSEHFEKSDNEDIEGDVPFLP